MIASAVMSPAEWPEEGHKHNQKRLMKKNTLQVPSNTNQVKNSDDAIGYAIDSWLQHKYAASLGESTTSIYRTLLISLRAYLQAQGLDLDGPESQLVQHIQTWANLRVPNSKQQGNVAPSTYNQRIAAISSFYTWTSKRGVCAWSNPTKKIRRTTVHKYAGSHALDVQQVRGQLKKIDCSTPRGLRDYVLLQVALNTGRSARELASLTWERLSLQGEHITLIFKGGRNGKVMCDTLDNRLSRMLLTYLHTIYGENIETLSPQTPIWISFSDRTQRQAIGQQTIADICETHLGVSKVQQLRHTFALTMDQLGAPVETIQTRLGHGNRSTTSTYLANLKEAHNPYAAMLANAFGL